MNFTAKDVADLRAKTGCGMMDCKKALVEAEGDVEAAVKILREKGLATAAKKEGRIAAEGIVDILKVGDTTAMIEVNSETDFVAKNDSFKEFVKGLLKTIIETKPATVEELATKTYSGTAQTVQEELTEKERVIYRFRALPNSVGQEYFEIQAVKIHNKTPLIIFWWVFITSTISSIRSCASRRNWSLPWLRQG